VMLVFLLTPLKKSGGLEGSPSAHTTTQPLNRSVSKQIRLQRCTVVVGRCAGPPLEDTPAEHARLGRTGEPMHSDAGCMTWSARQAVNCNADDK
jgi:hypothetical protein